MKIVKKVQQEYFEAILEGRKTFELRLADFKCKPGDTLVLKEQKQGTREFTGREKEFDITYIASTKEAEKFSTKEDIDKYGFVVLAINDKK
jgi:hypothetical protein